MLPMRQRIGTVTQWDRPGIPAVNSSQPCDSNIKSKCFSRHRHLSARRVSARHPGVVKQASGCARS